MKKMRKIIPALAMLLISAVMMSTASFAWFSMSQTAGVSGMQVNAMAGGALLVDDTNIGFIGGSSHAFTAENAGVNLDAITYDATNGYNYASKKADVNPDTGALGADGDVAAVPSATGYYVDYIVYLAADSCYTTSALTATVAFDGVGAANDTLKATTVDFYYAVLPVEKDATAAVKPDAIGTDATEKWEFSARQTVNATMTADDLTVTLASNLQIPAKNGVAVDTTSGEANGAIAVLMRVYFDGALAYDSTPDAEGGEICYVRSNAINTNAVKVSVTFNAPQA